MLKIRLARMGTKNEQKFRIVVAPARAKLGGKFLEILGFYLPKEKNKFKINSDRLNFWLEKGAQPSKAILRQVLGDGDKDNFSAKSRS